MDHAQRLQTARRIQQRLRHELGQGIDTERLLTDRLYARDVLLVCEALGGDLAALAQQLHSLDAPAPAAPRGAAAGRAPGR